MKPVAPQRHGIEVSAYYWISHHLTTDIEAAWTKARFGDSVEGEGVIDGTVPGVVSAGLTYYQRSNQLGSAIPYEAAT